MRAFPARMKPSADPEPCLGKAEGIIGAAKLHKTLFDSTMEHDGRKNLQQRFLGNEGFTLAGWRK